MLTLSAVLSACGGGGGGKGGNPPPPTFVVSANVSGLTGTGLVLRNNGGNDLAVSANGVATFSSAVASGASYSITVGTQPSGPAQTCTVTNGSGTIANAAVSNVAVNCILNAPDAPVVSLSSKTKSESLQWGPAARATFYRVFKTRSDTDFQLISGDLLVQTFSDDPVAVHLEDWAHLRYRVDACNATGCTSSAPGVPASNLPLIGYFKAQNSPPQHFFGTSAAISADGSTVAMGAIGEHKPGCDSAGAVYISARVSGHDTWFEQTHFNAVGTCKFAHFGTVVALSADGNTLAVTAAIQDFLQMDPAGLSGAVYIYTRSPSTRLWTQQAKLQALNPVAQDNFGKGMAISGDGNTLLVGAPILDVNVHGNAPDYGAAYVFTRDAGTWTLQPFVKASDSGPGDELLLNTVAISTDGGTLAIGGVAGTAKAVYVFQRSGNTWVQEASVTPPNPGGGALTALALSGDGTTFAVTSISDASNARGIGGDPTNTSMPSSGAANVYVRNSGTWTHQAYVKASNTDANDLFGTSIDLSDDGNIMAIGAPGESSRAAGVGGDQADNGSTKSGAAYVFHRVGSTWTQVNYVHSHSPDAEDLFGTSVSLTGDGATMLVNAPQEDGNGDIFNADPDDETAMQAGAAYIF